MIARLAAALLLLAAPALARADVAEGGGADGVDEARDMTTYRLKGAALLRPIRIGDDGVHTYIQWSEDQPIPAVFALDPRGVEQIVDGYMRGELFTIDRVYPHLVFRIDKDKAEARRNTPSQRGKP